MRGFLRGYRTTKSETMGEFVNSTELMCEVMLKEVRDFATTQYRLIANQTDYTFIS